MSIFPVAGLALRLRADAAAGGASASNIPMGITPPLRGSRRSPQASRWGGLPLNPKQSERAAKVVLKHHEANHSPLEGESARPGRSPQSSRWGGNETRLHPTNTGKSRAPTPVWMCWRWGTRRWLAPTASAVRLAARLLRLPLKGGVIGPSTAPMPSCLIRCAILRYRFDDFRERRAVPR